MDDGFIDMATEYDALDGVDLIAAMESAKADAKEWLAELKDGHANCRYASGGSVTKRSRGR